MVGEGDLPVYRMDDVVDQCEVPSPQYVKRDVDGDEEQVVAGGKRTFGYVRSAMIEVTPLSVRHVAEMMEEYGFHLESKRERNAKDQTWNHLFVK